MPGHLALLRNGATNRIVKAKPFKPQQGTAFATEAFQCNLVLLPPLPFAFFFNPFFFLLSNKEEEK